MTEPRIAIFMHLPLQTYSKPCPSQVPTAQQLAARATPASELQAAADKQVPYTFLLPESPTPGRCNAYLPSGPTTLTRFLWVVDFFVQSGFYVLVRSLAVVGMGAVAAGIMQPTV